tara:strand:+ start:18 stop:524 length:507 start_codon:yes stop_codon:yes gene_type:complete
MAGSLIKIDEQLGDDTQSAIDLTGIDSTYDVYVVQHSIKVNTSGGVLYVRFGASSTADTTSNYDRANKQLRFSTSFNNVSSTNQTGIQISAGLDNNDIHTGTSYLFNFNNSSEYSFMTYELNSGMNDRGMQGGAVLTVADSKDFIRFYFDTTSTFGTGSVLSLYGLKK